MSMKENCDFYIVPQRQSRAWWDLNQSGELRCSLCGAKAAPSNLKTCSGCGSNMTIDEPWTKRILEQGYRKEENTK